MLKLPLIPSQSSKISKECSNYLHFYTLKLQHYGKDINYTTHISELVHSTTKIFMLLFGRCQQNCDWLEGIKMLNFVGTQSENSATHYSCTFKSRSNGYTWPF